MHSVCQSKKPDHPWQRTIDRYAFAEKVVYVPDVRIHDVQNSQSAFWTSSSSSSIYSPLTNRVKHRVNNGRSPEKHKFTDLAAYTYYINNNVSSHDPELSISKSNHFISVPNCTYFVDLVKFKQAVDKISCLQPFSIRSQTHRQPETECLRQLIEITKVQFLWYTENMLTLTG